MNEVESFIQSTCDECGGTTKKHNTSNCLTNNDESHERKHPTCQCNNTQTSGTNMLTALDQRDSAHTIIIDFQSEFEQQMLVKKAKQNCLINRILKWISGNLHR